MKNILNKWGILLILTSLFFIGCNDDDDNEDSFKGSVTSITVENATDNLISLSVGDNFTVETKLLPENTPDKDKYTLRYKSSNEEVFTVDDKGIITAIGEGAASLRVESILFPDIWTTVAVAVGVPFFPVTSIEIDEKFKDFYMKTDETFDLKARITINPENASEPQLLYISSDDMIATVDLDGVVTTHALGDVTITAKAVDGSEASDECTIRIRNISYVDLVRTEWEVMETSYRYFADAAVKGTPESLIDGVVGTSFCIVKPGKSNISDNDGFSHTIPADAIPSFVIDMKEPQDISYFRLRHRNSTDGLRLRALSVYGSNDNTSYTPLMLNASVQVATTINDATVILPETFNYRYIKVVYEDWNKATSNSIQVAEFYMGAVVYEPLEPDPEP